MKISEQIKRQIRRELAASGGRARAKKYDKKTLSKWAKKGGRPKTGPKSDVAKLALREGISRQAAWYRLRKSKSAKPRKDGAK